jgi:hypothetical protein
MAPKEILAMFFERSNAMQQFWNYYLTVVGAVLAFFWYKAENVSHGHPTSPWRLFYLRQ